MKPLPFKLKITLYYTLFMMLFMVFTLGVIYTMGASSLLNRSDASIISTLNNAQDYIEYKDGIFKYDDYMQRLDESVIVVIYDKYGNLLYGSIPRLFPVDAPFSNTLETISLPNKNAYVYRDLDINVAGSNQTLVLRGISSYTRANASLNSFLLAALIIAPLVIALAILGGYRLMRQVFAPIDYVRETAQAISDGDDLKLRITSYENNDELAKLVETLNHMLQRLEDAFERERQFTDDVSHELRTPLSGMLLDIELMKSKSLREEHSKILDRLRQHTKWMIDLIQSMTLVSHHIQVNQMELLNLNQTIHDLSNLDFNKITISIDESLYFKGDVTLFNRIITNLVNNAFQYGASHVNISASEMDEVLKLIIRDNGQGIAPEHLPKIWHRFYQVDPSRHASHASGLGLSFVKQAIEALNWEIMVESQEHVYTQFTILIKN